MSVAYKVTNFRLPKVVYEYLFDLVSHVDVDTQQFFYHLLVGTVSNLNKSDGWTPIAKKFIREEWPECRLDKLSQLIEVKDLGDGKTYDKQKGICTKYRVRLDVIETMFKTYPKDMSKVVSVNLMTGKVLPFRKHQLKVGTNSIPDLVKKGIKGIKRCVVDIEKIESHLDSLELEIMDEVSRGKYLSDKYCYITLNQNNLQRLQDGVATYEPSYKMQVTGRISEIGGGMQSCSKIMKNAAFAGLSDIRNYDIKNSQVCCLLQWFEKAGLDTSWLSNYLETDKQVYADMVGISKDCWKQCLMALIYGADYNASIKDYLRAEVDTDEEASLLLTKFKTVVGPLKTTIDKWHNWLIYEWISDNSIYGKGRQKVYNPTGALFDINAYKNGQGDFVYVDEFKRKLSAFLLQGFEAAFIFHLTFISHHHHWEPISNQHDGLVTIGEIPQESIEYARKQSGFLYAELVEKPLV